MKPGRNEPCSCGSGKKYKHCCARHVAGSTLETTELAELAALIAAGRDEDLEHRAQALIGRRPNAGLAWKALSFALSRQGKDALPALENAARLMPDDAEAQSNLGNGLRSAGRLDEAAASHRRALALSPNHADAHNNLGTVLKDLGRLEEAATCYRRALELNPGFAMAHANLGIALRQLSRPAEAEASCRRALEIDPKLPAALVLIAELLADQGEFAEAENSFRRAVSIQPDLAEAWAAIAGLRKMTIADAGWLAEAERMSAQRLAPRRQIDLRYAIGKYFDDIGDFEQAFNHYRLANQLAKRQAPRYDPERTTRAIDLIIERYDGSRLPGASAGANDSPRPVFIVGMPRSGTTLAEQILASHPDVFGAGELPFWSTASVKQPAGGGAAAEGGAVSAPIARLAEDYLRLLDDLSPGARRVLDKMPENFLCLGLIHAALPNARIIHLRRDPLDTCVSIYFQNFPAGHAYGNDLEDLRHYYGEYLRLMQHWRSILPARTLLEVRYEDIVDDPETLSRRMVEFLGLPWNPACLDFHRTRRSIGTLSKWQARQRISKTSVGRSRHYEKFLGPLRGPPI